MQHDHVLIFVLYRLNETSYATITNAHQLCLSCFMEAGCKNFDKYEIRFCNRSNLHPATVGILRSEELLSAVYTITFWARHGLRLERCHFFSARHCTFTLIFLPCRFKNWHRTEHGCCTGAIFTAHTDFSHGTARLSVYTCVKAGTARLKGVPRSTYQLVVLGHG